MMLTTKLNACPASMMISQRAIPSVPRLSVCSAMVFTASATPAVARLRASILA